MMMARKGELQMHPRRRQGKITPRLRVPVRLAVALAAVTLAAAGCSHASANTASNSHPVYKITTCGTARTAANVPVKVEVTRGQVSCPDAMTVEHDYAKAILAGKAPGEGGGGPVVVSGWKCQGFPTPEVLKTGWASKCIKSGAEILAILPTPA
jgi:hypothetical protein